MTAIQLEILTPERIAFEDEVGSVYLQGSEGRIGILPAHTPLIASLRFGVLRCAIAGSDSEILCGDGFVEINDDRVSVLVKSAEAASEVDVERAKSALERARARINSKDKGVDIPRAEMARDRAEERLRFVKALRH